MLTSPPTTPLATTPTSPLLVDLSAREDLAIASMLGGLCLANAKLGVVHGYAAIIGEE